MPDEVAGDHSNILVAQRVLSTKLGLEISAPKVKRLCGVLASANSSETRRPNRPDLTRGITRMRDAALEISEALLSPHILSRLAAGDPGFEYGNCWAYIIDLHKAAEAALLTIPKGRRRAPGDITPKATCALLVAELFDLSGRKYPRPNNARAHAIAEALWRACGGRLWTGPDLTSWRRYFLEITKASPQHRQILRSFVRTLDGTKSQAKQAQ